jgi:hypothetical protein
MYAPSVLAAPRAQQLVRDAVRFLGASPEERERCSAAEARTDAPSVRMLKAHARSAWSQRMVPERGGCAPSRAVRGSACVPVCATCARPCADSRRRVLCCACACAPGWPRSGYARVMHPSSCPSIRCASPAHGSCPTFARCVVTPRGRGCTLHWPSAAHVPHRTHQAPLSTRDRPMIGCSLVWYSRAAGDSQRRAVSPLTASCRFAVCACCSSERSPTAPSRTGARSSRARSRLRSRLDGASCGRRMTIGSRCAGGASASGIGRRTW